ncbi:MAG: molecular chaperone TorD family protein [bacterium]
MDTNSAYLFHLLFRVFFKEIDPEFLSLLKKREIKEALAVLDLGLNGNENELIEELSLEYARLFILPGGISPYESVHISARLCGEPLSSVISFNKRAGLKPTSEDILADHIALELETVYQLKLKGLKELERQFLKERLFKWGNDFFNKVYEASNTKFYKGMALLGKELLEYEARKGI